MLPPSRGQTPGPDGGAPLDLTALSLPGLTERRRDLLTALRGTEHDIADSPTARACDVFTGVLYAAAGLPRLLARPGSAAERARRCVLITSPLLGMVGPDDRIPASRLAMGTVPGVGGLGAFWRPGLETALAERAEGELVVDVRSGEFTPLWRPPSSASWVTVRVEQDVDGERRVVSHFAKHLRGVLVGHLLRRRGAEPTDLRSLVRAARALQAQGTILAAEVAPSSSSAKPHVLTLVSP